MKKNPTFYVIGGTNIDCVGTPHHSIHQKDSNPAMIKTSFGGVACNIARNLAYLNQTVKFLTVFSTDGFGQDIKKHLDSLKVETRYSLLVDEPSAMYMAMLDNEKDLLLAMVDTSILNHINKDHIMSFLQETTPEDVVVFDTNLNKEIIECIITNAKGKIVCDPISIEKSQNVKPYLNGLSLFKPNIHQASTLSGIIIEDENSLHQVATYFNNQGIDQTLITSGDEGGVYIDANTIIKYSIPSQPIVNAVGAGDAMLASFIAFESTYDTIETLKLSVVAAYLTCLSEDTVDSTISLEKIINEADHLSINFEVINKGA